MKMPIRLIEVQVAHSVGIPHACQVPAQNACGEISQICCCSHCTSEKKIRFDKCSHFRLYYCFFV